MGDSADPRFVARSLRSDGLVVARQAPPAASASCSATYLAPAGSAFDPPSFEGVALLASQLVISGAGRRDRVRLARDLDRIGATMQSHCHSESAGVTVWGPSHAFGPLLAILADVVLRPRFEEEDLARVRRQIGEHQLRELTQPGDRAERELLRAVFPPGHPYRETGTGSRRSVARIRRRDVVRFHRDHFVADGAQLVVTVPRSLPDVRREVDRRFRGFERERGPAPPTVPSRRSTDAVERTVTMPGRTQVEILVGGPSIPRSAPEFAGAFLANEVLGGRPLLSRLFQRVREAQGLAYHASSDLESLRWGGFWTAQAGTGPDRVKKVLPILRAELERIRTELVSRRELEEIRESTIGEIPLQLETTSGAHQLAVEGTYFGLPEDFLRTWPDQLRAVRPRELRAGAEAALDATHACTVIAGPIRETATD